MLFPGFLLGALLATLYAALFHLWRGGGIGRLLLFLCLSWAGFVAGQLLAERMGWDFLSYGALHIGAASLASFLFLGIGYWLSLVERRK